MKCLLLAGGRGDRLWPLSRKNYPKQFIEIKNQHSIFQETVARNMAFCDEFIIVTNKEYQDIIENQMKAFRGLTYRCIYEEIGRKTTAAIVLACQQLPLSELLFVVSSDHLIEGESYKNDILEAKKLAKQGYLVTLNSGMYLFRNGDLLKELKHISSDVSMMFETAFKKRRTEGSDVYYDAEVLENVPALHIEECLLEKTDKARMIHSQFSFQDMGSLDDLENIWTNPQPDEQIISNKCENTTVINKSEKKLVLVNHLEDVLVVNTDDAVYVGKKGQADDLKEIIRASESMWDYFDKSSVFYRDWGQYDILEQNKASGYQVSKVAVFPGRTISSHLHEKKKENWCVISGKAKAVIDGKEIFLGVGENVQVNAGVSHQVSCISEEELVYIETSVGLSFAEKKDTVSFGKSELSEVSLGFNTEPFVKLAPVYMDYLWGGTRLRDQYGKQCEYDIIAESWELSAHPDGQSVIASGRYNGLLFGDYLKKIGKESLGWKYQSFRSFPLLIKLIDAKEDLSIQVHPDDEYALENENEYGKSEMWYVIDCAEEAYIYCGFKRDVSREEVTEHIEKGTLLSLLNKIQIQKGKTYFIPAGTIHAIGKGSLICEVQQNSNSTYRVYDFERRDKYGNLRKLDIEKALDVLDYNCYTGTDVSECKYFECQYVNCDGQTDIEVTEESFVAVMILDGSGYICYEENEMPFKKGDCIFIPKRNARMKVEGECVYLSVRI